MVLHGKDRELAMTQSFYGSIVQVEVRNLERWSSGNTGFIPFHRETVVLRRDQNPAALEIANWMVSAAVAVRELHGISTERESYQLMSEADTEDRYFFFCNAPDRLGSVTHGGGIAGTVREEHAIGIALEDGIGRCLRWNHSDTATVILEEPQDVALDAVIVGDN